MWGFGGRYYWGRRERNRGIVVVFAWMSSQERHMKNYVELYASLGWNSLICHSQFLNMFFPEKATTIASDILNELLKELKVQQCPVAFASFSGGPKACMCMVLQMLDRTCETELTPDDCQLIRDSICGFIYDSSPVDFTSDLGARFAVHPSVLNISQPPRLITWMANAIAGGLDALFLQRFEAQRAEYWQTLYSSVRLGASYLVLCSENDDLAPYHVISNFAERLKELGANVKLVKWEGTPHVGHYRYYPVDYKAAVSELLVEAFAIYSRKNQRPGDTLITEGTNNEISEPIQDLRKAAGGLHESQKGASLLAADNFFAPSSVHYFESRGVESIRDERNEGLIRLPSLQTITPHGVLSQILFDANVPKNIENWDVSESSSRQKRTSRRRHASLNPIKCIRRSRL